MVRLHAFLALLVGFAVMVAIALTVTALLRRLAPQWISPDQKLSPVYVLVNLAASFFSAAAGGFVTAWAAAEDNALRDVLALAIVILVLGAISALQTPGGTETRGPERPAFVSRVKTRGRQPIWSQMALLVIAPIGAVAGGLLRLHAKGIL